MMQDGNYIENGPSRNNDSSERLTNENGDSKKKTTTNEAKKTRGISINKSDMIYNYIPTLLELPDIKCYEFKEKFVILIRDLIQDINNINNKDPSIAMLYEQDIHIKNANEVLRAMIDCFHCIVNKIKDKNNNYYCNKSSEENTSNPLVNLPDSLNILRQTFSLESREGVDN